MTFRVDAIRGLGAPIGVDPLPLLAERGRTPNGTTSAGGATHLRPASDGWVALSLARPDDVDLLPAFLEGDDLEQGIAARTTTELVERATLLGLPLGALGEVTAADGPVVAQRLGDAEPLDRPPLVVDLSSLWAGPLCGRLLLERGARVVKVESATRPDESDLHDRLNAGKELRTVDLRTELPFILQGADVVIEASRPRALQQLGIDATTIPGPRVWVSITAHGRASNRVGFGDDCAVAGGLVDWDGDTPNFVGDAIADPLTGVTAAAAATTALQRGGRWLLDVALARVAASVALSWRCRPELAAQPAGFCIDSCQLLSQLPVRGERCGASTPSPIRSHCQREHRGTTHGEA